MNGNNQAKQIWTAFCGVVNEGDRAAATLAAALNKAAVNTAMAMSVKTKLAIITSHSHAGSLVSLQRSRKRWRVLL
jgi:hypothetical protein